MKVQVSIDADSGYIKFTPPSGDSYSFGPYWSVQRNSPPDWQFEMVETFGKDLKRFPLENTNEALSIIRRRAEFWLTKFALEIDREIVILREAMKEAVEK